MRWRIAGFTALAVLLLGALVYNLASGDATVSDDPERQPIARSQPLETPNLAISPSSSQTNPWTTFALIFMSAATLVSVSITFYLYKWRSILIGRPELLVPEKWAKHLDGIGQQVTALSGAIGDGLGSMSQTTARNSDRVSDMIETFMTLQNAIDERDSEIKRLKKGYDADVFRKFLNRFIRVDQTVDTYLQSKPEESESLGQVKRLMEDALDECGVESFKPVVGEDFRRAEGIADNPKKVKTEEKDDDYKILEVIDPGYRLRVGNSHEVLVSAKVRISVFET